MICSAASALFFSVTSAFVALLTSAAKLLVKVYSAASALFFSVNSAAFARSISALRFVVRVLSAASALSFSAATAATLSLISCVKSVRKPASTPSARSFSACSAAFALPISLLRFVVIVASAAFALITSSLICLCKSFSRSTARVFSLATNVFNALSCSSRVIFSAAKPALVLSISAFTSALRLITF